MEDTVNGSYFEGTSITLSPILVTPDEEYNFDGWYVNNSKITLGTGNSYTLPTDGTTSLTIVAKFTKKPTTMKAKESGVGYYIKKGDEYAIVFADRLAQASTEQDTPVTWSDTNSSTCTFPKITGDEDFKTYVISDEEYTDPRTTADSTKGFGTHKVIKLADRNTGTEDRFMALALTDYPTDSETSTWYSAASGNMENPPTQTSKAFLTGKTNTETILKKGIAGSSGGYGALASTDVWYKLMTGWTDAMKMSWATSGYGATSSNDAWGKAKQGWFIPSFEEWSAFGYAMKNNKFKSNSYSALGIGDCYWSSSQDSATNAWNAYFLYGRMKSFGVKITNYVRLATTF